MLALSVRAFHEGELTRAKAEPAPAGNFRLQAEARKISDWLERRHHQPHARMASSSTSSDHGNGGT